MLVLKLLETDELTTLLGLAKESVVAVAVIITVVVFVRFIREQRKDHDAAIIAQRESHERTMRAQREELVGAMKELTQEMRNYKRGGP